jgi:hypothetical protein
LPFEQRSIKLLKQNKTRNEIRPLFALVKLAPPLHKHYFVTFSFPEHARSQVKGGHSSGEIELIQACDWLTADSISMQIVRWISNVSSTHAWQLLQNINKVFGISRRKFATFLPTEID